MNTVYSRRTLRTQHYKFVVEILQFYYKPFLQRNSCQKMVHKSLFQGLMGRIIEKVAESPG